MYLCCRVNHALSLGLKVGLGTDVAGGVSPSMLTAQRMAVVNSRGLRARLLARSGGIVVTPDMEAEAFTYKVTFAGCIVADHASHAGFCTSR